MEHIGVRAHLGRDVGHRSRAGSERVRDAEIGRNAERLRHEGAAQHVPEALARRDVDPPVIAVVRDGRTLLDCRTLSDAEADEIVAAIAAARS